MTTSDVTAVVLTHRRPRLVTELVRSLLRDEKLEPHQIVVVVDGDGGLADRGLESAVRTIRLPGPSGPAAGFRAGIDVAFADPSVRFAYLCEDDVGLVGMPSPRLSDVRDTMQDWNDTHETRVGAVVAYGRVFARRPGVTVPYTPDALGDRLQPVDVAAWGATLMSRSAYDAGVVPDDFWFFGYEDFDFFLRLHAAGLLVMVHRDTGLATLAATSTNQGRDEALAGRRPRDADEAWRAYYVARNQFELARRHGNRRWLLWHALYSARRLQRAGNGSERRAILVGLADGLRGRSGKHARYVRLAGENDPSGPDT